MSAVAAILVAISIAANLTGHPHLAAVTGFAGTAAAVIVLIRHRRKTPKE